jgi:hypothetical protein
MKKTYNVWLIDSIELDIRETDTPANELEFGFWHFEEVVRELDEEKVYNYLFLKRQTEVLYNELTDQIRNNLSISSAGRASEEAAPTPRH